MSAVNPYAPPRSRVADVYEDADEFQPVKTWSGEGRIGRLRYLAHLTGGYLVFAVVAGVLSAGLGAARMPGAITVVTSVGAIVYFVFALLKNIQRSHDMNWSGWWGLVALIPVVGLIWVFGSGTKGSNRYGAPPPANTLGIKVLGLLFPIVATIGIIAAIALPAYSNYVKKAKAVQLNQH